MTTAAMMTTRDLTVISMTLPPALKRDIRLSKTPKVGITRKNWPVVRLSVRRMRSWRAKETPMAEMRGTSLGELRRGR